MSEESSPGKYVLVYALLVGLVLVTAVAGRIPLGAGNAVVALVVAAAKAVLIALFFMHLRTVRHRMPWIVALAALFWLGILFTLTLSDYLARGAIGVAGK